MGPGNAPGLLSAAFAQPQPINRLATNSSLTAQEQATVKAYAEYWINQLATGEPEAIRNAGRAINEPLSGMGVTRVFRDEYSRAAVPLLREALGRNSNNEVAVNAMKIGALLGTDRALGLMVEHSDPRREQRMAVRLWAAKGFQLLAEAGLIEARQLTGPTRELARAAAREDNWLVFRRQFEALAAVPGSLDRQVEVLDAVAKRLQEEEKAPNPMVESLHRALVLLRNQWMNLANVREQRTFGESAGPAIVRVIEVAEAHWEEAETTERASGWYGAAVQAAETLLIAIDLQVRPDRRNAPDSALDAAWQRRDREAFRTYLRTWQEITAGAPYKQPASP